MIKKLIIGLVVLNIAYFSWLFTMGNGIYIPPETYEEGVTKLTLLPADKDTISKGLGGKGCYAFGPFDSERSAKDISNKINSFGVSSDITTKETTQVLNYFVYLQPFASQEEAKKVIAEISKHEVKQ